MLASANFANAGDTFGFSSGFNAHFGNNSTRDRTLGLIAQVQAGVHRVELRIIGLGAVVVRLFVVELLVIAGLASCDASLGVIVGTLAITAIVSLVVSGRRVRAGLNPDGSERTPEQEAAEVAAAAEREENRKED